jgi:hypothetical protein
MNVKWFCKLREKNNTNMCSDKDSHNMLWKCKERKFYILEKFSQSSCYMESSNSMHIYIKSKLSTWPKMPSALSYQFISSLWPWLSSNTTTNSDSAFHQPTHQSPGILVTCSVLPHLVPDATCLLLAHRGFMSLSLNGGYNRTNKILNRWLS